MFTFDPALVGEGGCHILGGASGMGPLRVGAVKPRVRAAVA